jgi:hypothetical protein
MCFMCRYSSGLYLPKMVCFKCRRSFKEISRCPECGDWLESLGRDFKPPRRADVKAWRVVVELYSQGVIFDSCGCSGPGWRLTSKRDIAPFMKRRQLTTEVQKLMGTSDQNRRKRQKKILPRYKMAWCH